MIAYLSLVSKVKSTLAGRLTDAVEPAKSPSARLLDASGHLSYHTTLQSVSFNLSGACDVKRVAKHALSRTDPVTQSLQIDTIFPGGVTIWRTFVGDSALLGRNQLAYETRRRATLDSNGNARLQNTPALRMECKYRGLEDGVLSRTGIDPYHVPLFLVFVLTCGVFNLVHDAPIFRLRLLESCTSVPFSPSPHSAP